MFFTVALCLLLPPAAPSYAAPAHGIAMHGMPDYPPDFKHFSYVNPDAPKGGRITYAAVGSFDSLNPLTVKGIAALNIRALVYESLMARSYDEPFSLYGLIAESIETPEERNWVQFTLRPEARFADGSPVTVDDVVFSLKTLREKGRPNHRFYYSKVVSIERPAPRTVRFVFADGSDRELPLILGLMPIISKAFFSQYSIQDADFTKPLGSGPYQIKSAEPGKRVVFQRNPNYWGRDLAVNKGRHNFDEIVYDYYQDDGIAFEAFKAGLYDVRFEPDPTRWITGYDFPDAREGHVVTRAITRSTPSGMTGFVFNSSRTIFSDVRVRKALGLLFDFEWINKNLYHGVYTRTRSYFDNSGLSSHGRAASTRERALLTPFPQAVTPEIMEHGYQAPVSDGTGRDRTLRREAIKILEDAGWHTRDGQLKRIEDGTPFSFEILITDSDKERLALIFADSLKRVGIKAALRVVDDSQYQKRLQTRDFDMIINFWPSSLSPGNEQLVYWASQSADQPGTRNYMGVRSAAVDAMIEALLLARNRTDFTAAVRSLDRVLLSGYYVIPLFFTPDDWVAFRNTIGVPDTETLYGYRIDTWWRNPNP
ncbi:MAG: extracellular solute-binding protein [Parvularculales bacterium]